MDTCQSVYWNFYMPYGVKSSLFRECKMWNQEFNAKYPREKKNSVPNYVAVQVICVIHPLNYILEKVFNLPLFPLQMLTKHPSQGLLESCREFGHIPS